MRTKKN